MEAKIIKYKKIYKIFAILMAIALIDSIVVPVILKNMSSGTEQSDIGFIPLILGYVLGSAGIWIGVVFNQLWFIWGLIAAISKRMANRLEKKVKATTTPL